MTPSRNSAPESDELLKGTLDMLVLRTLTVQPMHGYAIVRHIERLSGGVFNIEHGSLYPALERLSALDGDRGEDTRRRHDRWQLARSGGSCGPPACPL
ncbi:MAG TPA: helix-turn-helix transcriptional regulator [Gemmatimonadaceae bacterium]|nr:helix-turn-helix transcriptional regulator [Gemmatimonadaceae bacterium]